MPGPLPPFPYSKKQKAGQGLGTRLIWDRIQFESEMIPSTEAQYHHWRLTCWVLDMWKAANNNHMVLHSLANFGWKVTDESLTFDWDSESNMEAVRQRVIQLLKGL